MQLRIAVIDRKLCNPDKCYHECRRFCPPVLMNIDAVKLINKTPIIDEGLCTGCGICTKKCPFRAISIVNLPTQLERDLVHQYGINGFRLFRLITPKLNQVLGVIGRNGTGKSTAIKILAGRIVPNLGHYEKAASKDEVLEYYRGRQLYFYFKELYDGRLRVAYKPQEVYLLPRLIHGTVREILKKADEVGNLEGVAEALELKKSLDKDVHELSGGEIQRTVIAAAALKDADVYLFDEPSSYNDVYERMAVTKFIRSLSKNKYVVVVDHDLAFLDYVSDVVSVVYGEPGVYGVFTREESVRTGINIFLDGYIPSDNLMFRKKPITFSTTAIASEVEGAVALKYTTLIKRFDGFELVVKEGEVKQGEVIGILGPNAIGKTTFFRMLVGELPVDEGQVLVKPSNIAYKPQYLSTDYPGKVRDFLAERSGIKSISEDAVETLLKPLNIHNLLDRDLESLSGGELQKVYIAATLLKDADLYLLDEPSAFIDVEDRIEVAVIIDRHVKLKKKPAIVIDHDLLVVDAVADKLLIFYGEPGRVGHTTTILPKRDGMNLFLSHVNITLRRDRHSGRPRINKPGSRLDREQKEKKMYYYLE